MSEKIIEIKNVRKSFDENQIVKGMNLDVYKGEFLTLLGPSGCGKTTLLRMIGGFLEPDEGDIILDGKSILGTPPYKREVNTVFQSYALFPNLTVRDNITFGLKMKKLPKAEIDSKVQEIIEMCQLEMLANRKPSKLSGGQQQRVAIARSLVNAPKVLLLDEPLGALDLQLRKQMQISLKRLQRKLGMTYIYVTHDQEEAMTLSDRIVVINNGQIEQVGTAQEIYGTPSTLFSAQFLGESNFFTQDDGSELSVRPEYVQLTTKVEARTGGKLFEGKIKDTTFMGPFSRISVELLNGQVVHALEPSGINAWSSDQTVYIQWNPEDSVLIKKDA